jgi:hypothetical protein
MKKKTIPPRKPRVKKLIPPQRAQPKQRVLRPQPSSLPRQVIPVPEESIEKMLMKMILNPKELKTQITRIEPKRNPYGVSSVKQEGMIVNSQGVQQQVQEEIKYVSVFKDGTPVTQTGFTRCQTCNQIVGIDNIHRCPCGQTCCVSQGCGIYIERQDQWYCCKKHALLSMCKINLRFFS